MPRVLLVFWSLVAMWLLTSCGYHLRGAVALPPQMHRVYVQNASPQLVMMLDRLLQAASGHLVGTPAEAGIILKVTEENLRRQGLSLGPTGRATEFQLYYLLSFELLDSASQNIVLPTKTFELTRSYYNDQTQIIAKAGEEQIILDELYMQAARSLIDRMRGALDDK